VTKRFFTGFFVTPAGWPEGSPMISSTLNCYRVIWACHRNLTPKYRALVAEARQHKQVHHLTTPAQIDAFLGSQPAAAGGYAIDR
jgi:hypothetical protein